MAFVIAAIGVVFGFILSNKQLERIWLQYRDKITDRASYIREYKKMVRIISVYMTCIGVVLLVLKEENGFLWLILVAPILVELCMAPKITSKYTRYKES